MRKQIGVDADAKYYRVFDKDTGKEIKHCFFADDETGEFGVYASDEHGNMKAEKDVDGTLFLPKIMKRGSIEFRLLNDHLD